MAMQTSGSSSSLEESFLSSSIEESTLFGNEFFQDQRQKYHEDKKRIALKRQSTLEDPGEVLHSDWLKIRGLLKRWKEYWCVIKPGILFIFKSSEAKSCHWIGTVLLNYCEIMERPTKMEGFCFTLFHPVELSIWATKGPEGKTKNSVVKFLPSNHLILLAPSEAERKVWMDALEMAIHSPPLPRSSNTTPDLPDACELHEADYESAFKDLDLNDTSLTYESDFELEPDHLKGLNVRPSSVSESEHESLLWMRQENQDELANSVFQETPCTHTEEGEIGEALDVMGMKDPNMLQHWDSFLPSDTYYERPKRRHTMSGFGATVNELRPFGSYTDKRLNPMYQRPQKSFTEQKKKKKVFIMNYIKFPKSVIIQCGVELKLDLRQGAKKDSENLRSTFEKLGYEVILHENLTADETNKILDDIAQDTSLDFLLLFVLSHGVDEDTFLTLDGSQNSLEEVQYRFTDKKCPHLRGKSKIILSNFCRGDNIEKLEWDSAPVRSETPHHMITIYASHKGFKAGRTPKRGTLFVYNLCEVLKVQPNLPIQDVFNLIYERMANDIGQTPKMEVSAPFANFVF